jgi:HD-like signal output (HDOD) protein
MNEQLIQEIDDIPMLPESIYSISRVYNDHDASIADMVKALQNDATIVANILKLANAPLYGFSREIKDISQAVALFGKENIRSFALNLAALECIPVKLDVYGMTTENYMKKTQLQNALAAKWLGKVDRVALEHLSTATFLVEIGKVIISRYIEKKALSSAFSEAIASGQSHEAAEVEFCGSKSEDISVALFKKWNFDPSMVEIIEYVSNPDGAPDPTVQKYAAYLQIVVAAVTKKGEMDEQSKERALALINHYALEKEPFIEAIHKVTF